MFESMTVRQKILLIASVSLVIHVAVTACFTHLGDPSYWPRIMQTVDSGNGIYGLDGNYYTPLWGYMLSFLDMCLRFLGLVPHMGEIYTEFLGWANVSVADPFILSPEIVLATKIPLCICDILVGYEIYRIVKEFTQDDGKAVLSMAMWCFCPMVVYMAGVQGQFDTISMYMVLLTIRLLREDKVLLAGFAFGASVWLKLFPSVCLFLFVGYLIARYGKVIGIRKSVVAAVAAVAATVLIFLPQIMNGELGIAFGFFTGRVNSPSESGIYNMIVTVRMAFMLLLTLGLMVWSYIGITHKKKDLDRYTYLYAGVLIAVATIISRGYQYTPSFIGFILLFAMISDRTGSYRSIFYFISIATVCDAFFSVGPSVLAIPAVYYGMLDADWVESISAAFINTVGHSSSLPIGWTLAIAWAVMLWIFVIIAVGDLTDRLSPKMRSRIDRLKEIVR